jgi:acetyl esterase/lipase
MPPMTLLIVAAAIVAIPARAADFTSKIFNVSITNDITYTTVDLNGGGTADMKLDIYEPAGGNVPALKPAFVMLHGGGWTIYSKASDATEFPPSSGTFINSSVTEYATEFARRGYVCVSIDYPKTYDFSAGADYALGNGYLSGIGSDTAAITANLNALLTSLSIPTLSETHIINTIEAAIQCSVDAVDWLTANAATYGIDPNRIAMGGWSAGAITSAHSKNAGANVAAIWLNSAGGVPPDASLFIDASTPPTVQFHGTADGVIPVSAARAIRDELVTAGVTHEYYERSGGSHYYFLDTLITAGPSRAVPDSVENLIADFMFTELNLGPLSTSLPAQGSAGLRVLSGALLAVASLVLLRVRASWASRKSRS